MRSQKDYSAHTEMQLWKLIARDCKPAFLELFDRYGMDILCAARSSILSGIEARDLLVVIFTKAWDERMELASRPNFKFSKYLSQKFETAILEHIKKLQGKNRLN